MNILEMLPDAVGAWCRLTRAELAPFPGRADTTLRLVVTSAIAIVISMAWQIPYLILTLVAVFYVVQANVVLSRLVGVIFILCTGIAIPLTILLLKYTFDYPLLRILSASLIFFISMYLTRVLKIGVMFLGVGLIAIYVQTFADLTDQTGYLVSQMLWSCFAMIYGILLALAINTWLFPAEPLRQLQEEAHRQLSWVVESLSCLASGNPARQPLDSQALQQGTVTLQKLTLFAGMRHADNHAGKLYLQVDMATIARIRHLNNALSATLAAGLADPILKNTAQRLSEQVSRFDAAITAEQAYSLSWAPTQQELEAMQAVPQLADMYRTLLALNHFDAAQAVSDQPAAREPMWVPDALTNPIYLRFAVKALLCSLISYLFYNAVQWPGIHTMMLTCALVAYPTLGSTVRRLVLRFYGGLLGSLAALILFIFILPRIDSIVGLLLVILPVLAVGAWVSAGSERSSYIGMQMFATFALALFEHFGPSSDLTEIRDRLIGILLGVLLCTFVYAVLWPESESTALRQKLTTLLHALAALIRPPGGSAEDKGVMIDAQQHLQCWAQLNECDEMLERVMLEPQFQTGAGALLARQATALLARCREVLVAQGVLHHHALDDLKTVSPPAHQIIRATQAQAADILDDYADRIERADIPPVAAQQQLLSASDLLAHTDAADSGVKRMLVDAQQLALHVAHLPNWTTAGANAVTAQKA